MSLINGLCVFPVIGHGTMKGPMILPSGDRAGLSCISVDHNGILAALNSTGAQSLIDRIPSIVDKMTGETAGYFVKDWDVECQQAPCLYVWTKLRKPDADARPVYIVMVHVACRGPLSAQALAYSLGRLQETMDFAKPTAQRPSILDLGYVITTCGAVAAAVFDFGASYFYKKITDRTIVEHSWANMFSRTRKFKGRKENGTFFYYVICKYMTIGKYGCRSEVESVFRSARYLVNLAALEAQYGNHAPDDEEDDGDEVDGEGSEYEFGPAA